MTAFERLPGFQRSPAGLEWTLWKRLPLIWLLGTLIPVAYGLACWWWLPAAPTAEQDRAFLLLVFRLIGVIVLHATVVLTVAIGCIVVRVMKGPAYVADAYPPAEREQISSMG